jgi:hypothetical protein
MKDLVTQAYLKMHANPAKEAAMVLNNGKEVNFRAHTDNHYSVKGDGDTTESSMAKMADTLESNGFGHLYQDGNVNHFVHFDTNKKLNIRTVQEEDGGIYHYLKRS